MATLFSKVEPLEVVASKTKFRSEKRTAFINDDYVRIRLIRSKKKPATILAEMGSVIYILYYTPGDGKIPVKGSQDIIDRHWFTKTVKYNGTLYFGLFETISFHEMVEEILLPGEYSAYGVECDTNDTEKGIIGPVRINNADFIDEKIRIFRAPFDRGEGFCLKMKCNRAVYSLFMDPTTKEPKTLTLEEAAKSIWTFKLFLHDGFEDKCVYIHEIYKKKNKKEGLGPFRYLTPEETTDLPGDKSIWRSFKEADKIQEDKESVNSLESFKYLIPTINNYNASELACLSPFPSTAEISYPKKPILGKNYFSAHVEGPYMNSASIQEHINVGLGDIQLHPQAKYHRYKQKNGLKRLQKLLNAEESEIQNIIDKENQELDKVLEARKKERVQYVVQRAAAPIEKVKAMREEMTEKVKAMGDEMTETQNLTAGYCICFLISILIVVGFSFGLLALLMNPPSFLTEMP